MIGEIEGGMGNPEGEIFRQNTCPLCPEIQEKNITLFLKEELSQSKQLLWQKHYQECSKFSQTIDDYYKEYGQDLQTKGEEAFAYLCEQMGDVDEGEEAKLSEERETVLWRQILQGVEK